MKIEPGYNGKYGTPKRSIAVGNFDKFNKDSSVYVSELSIGLIVAPWKFDVLKTSIFALELSGENKMNLK